MKLLDFFESIYIINLPERKDRRKLITQELKKHNIPLIPGQVEIFPAIRPENVAGFPSIGVRGCYLSHLQIIKQAKERGLKNVLIMEDDLEISSQLREYEENILKRLSQHDWGFVYLGHQLENLEKENNGLIIYNKPIVTAHFYGVNEIIFDRLIAFLELVQSRPPGHPDGGPMHVDGAFSTFRSQNPDVLTLVACPNLGRQKPSRSSLSEKWFESLPVIQQIAEVGRMIKRAFF